MPDDLSEFEEQVSDIEDPSFFVPQPGRPNNGLRVTQLLNEAVSLMLDDLVPSINEGRGPYGQYLDPHSGFSITMMLVSERELALSVQFPSDHPPLITWEKDDGDSNPV